MDINPEIKKRLIGFASSYEEPYPVQVQGESSYRANIEKICGNFDEEEGYNDDSHQAALYLEDDNQYDPGNAVLVQINDLKVGYLSRPNAKTYRQKLTKLKAPSDAIAICGASIRGGFLKKDSTQADFGIRLDFDLLNPKLVPLKIKDEPEQKQTSASPKIKNEAHKKNRGILLLVWLFTGFLGGHYFYVGRIGMGLLYLFTGGLFLIGWVVDFFNIIGNHFRDYKGNIV